MATILSSIHVEDTAARRGPDDLSSMTALRIGQPPHAFRQRRIPCALVLALAFSPVWSHADELTRRLQEELRRRYQYFGEIDGRPSDELTGALRSYQKRKGIEQSGAADLATVRSLGLPVVDGGAAQLAIALPDVPVLKSDQARQISEADREFLRNLDKEAEENAATSVALPPVAQPPRGDADEAAVKQFIRDYLTAAEGADPSRELGFYAPRVDYFDHGVVPESFIDSDVRRYYKR